MKKSFILLGMLSLLTIPFLAQAQDVQDSTPDQDGYEVVQAPQQAFSNSKYEVTVKTNGKIEYTQIYNLSDDGDYVENNPDSTLYQNESIQGEQTNPSDNNYVDDDSVPQSNPYNPMLKTILTETDQQINQKCYVSENSLKFKKDNSSCPLVYFKKVVTGQLVRDPNQENRIGLVLGLTEFASDHDITHERVFDDHFIDKPGNEVQSMFFITVFNLKKGQSADFKQAFDSQNKRYLSEKSNVVCRDDTKPQHFDKIEQYDVYQAATPPPRTWLHDFGTRNVSVTVKRLD